MLVHGIFGSLDVWSPVFEALAGDGRTVAALDLPGHGESTKALAFETLERLSSTVVAYLDAIGADRAHLVGHSMGGMISLDVARRWPSRVRSLALLCPTPLGRSVNLEWVGKFLEARDADELAPWARMTVADEALAAPELIESVLSHLRMEGARAALRQIVAGVFDSGALATDWRDAVRGVPTAVLWGDCDRIVVPPDPASFAGTDVELSLVPGVGHVLPIEAPAEVHRWLVESTG